MGGETGSGGGRGPGGSAAETRRPSFVSPGQIEVEPRGRVWLQIFKVRLVTVFEFSRVGSGTDFQGAARSTVQEGSSMKEGCAPAGSRTGLKKRGGKPCFFRQHADKLGLNRE